MGSDINKKLVFLSGGTFVLLILGLSRENTTNVVRRMVNKGSVSPLEVGLAPALGKKADKIVVLKKQRKLILLKGTEEIKQYKISLGTVPTGHKEREGDGKTPEGVYKISGRNPQSSFHLSLRVDYPRKKDIEVAEQKGVSPGGDIMIHGLPNGTLLPDSSYKQRDWTLGCIAVDNTEIEEIWQAVDDGTTIEILP